MREVILASRVHIACTLKDHEATEETPLRATEGATSSSRTDVLLCNQNAMTKTKTSMAGVAPDRPLHSSAAVEAVEVAASSAREAAGGLRRALAGIDAGGATDGRRGGVEAHEQGGASVAAGKGLLSVAHTGHA